jgi:hypothetical protein
MSLVTIMQFYLSQDGVPELTLVYGAICAGLTCWIMVTLEITHSHLDCEEALKEKNS